MKLLPTAASDMRKVPPRAYPLLGRGPTAGPRRPPQRTRCCYARHRWRVHSSAAQSAHPQLGRPGCHRPPRLLSCSLATSESAGKGPARGADAGGGAGAVELSAHATVLISAATRPSRPSTPAMLAREIPRAAETPTLGASRRNVPRV